MHYFNHPHCGCLQPSRIPLFKSLHLWAVFTLAGSETILFVLFQIILLSKNFSYLHLTMLQEKTHTKQNTETNMTNTYVGVDPPDPPIIHILDHVDPDFSQPVCTDQLTVYTVCSTHLNHYSA
jgi:hypothetical protein